jgi:hypothetical protein
MNIRAGLAAIGGYQQMTAAKTNNVRKILVALRKEG